MPFILKKAKITEILLWLQNYPKCATIWQGFSWAVIFTYFSQAQLTASVQINSDKADISSVEFSGEGSEILEMRPFGDF